MDRAGDRGGGIVIYIKHNLFFRRRTDLEVPGLETLWIDITFYNKHILLGIFYVARMTDTLYQLVDDNISQALDNNLTDCIIMGDFNVNFLTGHHTRLHDIFNSNGLTQIVSKPTRITPTCSTLLDLISVSRQSMVINTDVLPPFYSDRHSVYVQTTFKLPHRNSYKRLIWDHSSINKTAITSDFTSFNWDSLIYQDNIHQSCEDITTKIRETMCKYTPHKVVTVRLNDKPWMNGHIRRLMRRRDRAHNKAKSTNTSDHWKIYRDTKNLLIDTIRQAKRKYDDNMCR